MYHNVFVTGKCNLACDFCFAKFIRRDKDNRERIIEEVKKTDEQIIRFCGGEPFLKWDFLKELIEVSPVPVSINTNGRLIKEEYIDYLNDRNIQVQLSVDGYDKGYRKLIDVDVDLFNKINNRAINQIDNNLEDIPKIYETIKPQVYEISILFGKRVSVDYAYELRKTLPEYILLSRVNDDDGQTTTHQTGNTYKMKSGQFRKFIGEEVWKILEGRRFVPIKKDA